MRIILTEFGSVVEPFHPWPEERKQAARNRAFRESKVKKYEPSPEFKASLLAEFRRVAVFIHGYRKLQQKAAALEQVIRAYDFDKLDSPQGKPEEPGLSGSSNNGDLR